MMTWPWPDDPASPRQGRTPPATLDKRLTQRVAERLRAHPSTRRARLTVEVQNGVALLTGTADSPEVERVAAEIAWDTEGIRDVCSMLRCAEVPRGSTAEGDVERASPERKTGPAAMVAGIATAWWLTFLLIAALGWAGVVIACVGATVALEVLRGRRSARV
ncbi:BON domain-containing protein [Actinoplanes sp. NPDC049316]|uniref:BON domain-containing protein n=1 Tax=Actinoplanes sp. NPDC049316 TaxID=3154727 RepID=UPI0034326CCA